MQTYLATGQVNRYNSLVPGVNSQITAYNQKVGQYNQYAHDVLGTQTAPAPHG